MADICENKKKIEMLTPYDFLICGTGASEGVPVPFCNCPLCVNARKIGGHEIRMRAGYQLGKTIHFDFSADALAQAQRFHLDYSKLQHLFFTHSHDDHLLAVDDFATREQALCQISKTLHIYGNQAVFAKLNKSINQKWQECHMKFHQTTCGIPIHLGKISVTPLEANHIPSEQCLLYFIETPNANLLLATDTSTFPEKTFQFLADKPLDNLLIDSTFGTLDHEWGHLGIPGIRRILNRLRKSGTITSKTKIYPTHISHYCTLKQQDWEAYPDFIPTFDGMTINLGKPE